MFSEHYKQTLSWHVLLLKRSYQLFFFFQAHRRITIFYSFYGFLGSSYNCCVLSRCDQCEPLSDWCIYLQDLWVFSPLPYWPRRQHIPGRVTRLCNHHQPGTKVFCLENGYFRKLIHSTMDFVWIRNKPSIRSAWLENRLPWWQTSYSFYNFLTSKTIIPALYSYWDCAHGSSEFSSWGCLVKTIWTLFGLLGFLSSFSSEREIVSCSYRRETCLKKNKHKAPTEGTHIHFQTFAQILMLDWITLLLVQDHVTPLVCQSGNG